MQTAIRGDLAAASLLQTPAEKTIIPCTFLASEIY